MNDVYKCPTCNDIRVYLTDSYAKQERAAIVAWLRSKEEMVEVYTDSDGENSWRILSGSEVANIIKRGEHVKKTGKTLHDDETCKETLDDQRKQTAHAARADVEELRHQSYVIGREHERRYITEWLRSDEDLIESGEHLRGRR